MAEQVTDYAVLFDRVEGVVRRRRAPALIGIAGAPASGKSTLAERLVDDLTRAGFETRFCPMDGFHLTNAALDAAGLRRVKGRIDTFDAAGFAAAVARLTSGDAFWWPHYSRRTHEPEPQGTRIGGGEAACIIEGNYILADRDPWRRAAAAFDLRIFVDADDATLRARLARRHQQGGRSAEAARAKIDGTDMPNAAAIRAERIEPDILFAGAANA